MQLNFQIPDDVVEALDKFVDGVRFRNRAQLITIILVDWIAKRSRPPDTSPKKYIENPSGEIVIIGPKYPRTDYKKELLGEKGNEWQEQGVDLLDHKGLSVLSELANDRLELGYNKTEELIEEVVNLIRDEVDKQVSRALKRKRPRKKKLQK